jgi:lipopolysaccharide biosynthesis glycosyltransferase
LSRFHALELFNILEFDRIFFLDSDMVVIDSMEPLLTLPEGFYACAEWFSGKARRFSDFITIDAGIATEDDIKIPVNTGFMLISKAFLRDEIYWKLLNFLTPDHWKNSATSLTDQLIINKYFHTEIKVISSRYNYRPKIAAGILRAENLKPEEAVVIHYLLKAKPWNFQEVWRTSSTNLEMLKAYEIWYNSYFGLLSHLHLDQNVNLLKKYASNQ